jgi:hypothetical protein
MAKYRTLSLEELNLFEKEFVDFLVVNGIKADDWSKMKGENSEKAQRMTALFSDLVFEKIMRQAKFMECYSESVIQAVQCLEDKMIMVAINRLEPNVDLTKVELSSLDSTQFELIKGEKKYVKSREVELFEKIQNGFQISDGRLFKQLILSTV